MHIFHVLPKLMRHLSLAVAIMISAITPVHADTGNDWLAAQFQADGSITTNAGIATAYQSTAEALRLWKANGANKSLTPTAIQFLENNSYGGTEYLARLILARNDSGLNVIDLTDKLKRHANADGGFGELENYDSSVLDTAFALQALNAAGAGGYNVAVQAMTYLNNKQKADGGWLDGSNSSNVYTTALAVEALIPYINQYSQAAQSISNATNFLLSQKDNTGLWASNLESALALSALTQSLSDRSSIAASVSALSARQQIDGSWDEDVYTTALVLRLLAIQKNPVANPSLSALQGRILDGGTGNVLSGVMVSLKGSVLSQTLSDQDGYFEFTSLQPGQYEVTANLPGYSTLSTITDLAAGRITNLGTLNLLILAGKPQTATIMGTVTDANTGLALAGVSIISGTQTTLTAANGSYQLNNVAPGSVTVNADIPGYIGASGQADVSAGGVLIFSPRLSSGISDTSNSYVFGMIKNAETGLPLAGVAVNINGSLAGTTDSAGAYRIEPLAEGLTTFSASLAGYNTVLASSNVSPHNRYEFSPQLYAIGSTPPLNANTAGISGTVMDASTNLPLSGVTVKAHHDNSIKNLTTDNTGKFTVSGITDAEILLEFSSTGYQSVSLSYPVLPLESIDIGQIRLRPNSVAALLPDLTVTSLNQQNLVTDPSSLKMTGAIQAVIKNQGTTESPADVQIIAYYDLNRNNAYDTTVDTPLGISALSLPLSVNGNVTVNIPIDGVVAFRDAPVSVWVDSLRSVAESKEDNNQLATSSLCRGQPLPIATLDPVLKWHWSGSSYQPSYNQVMSTPVVAQLNDDNNDGLINTADTPDIVFEAFSTGGYIGYTGKGLLRALSGKDGKEIWATPETPRWVSGFFGPAVGDIDNDGLVEIVIGGPNLSGLMVYENDGRLKWSIPESAIAQPALADLDHDGNVEIVYGNKIYNANGRLLFTAGYSNSIPAIADLDGDGFMELIAGGSAYNYNGTLKWNRTSGIGSAIGNFDNDSNPEIAVQTGGSVYVLEHDGTVKWGPVVMPGGGGGSVTVADFDGDGQPEIGTAGASNYVVFETDGSIKWKSSTQDFSSKVTGSSVFDFDGDGKAEVLYGDEHNFRIYEGATGQVLFSTPNPSGTLYEYPLIADIDNDHHAELIVVSNNYAFSGTTGIRVFQNRNDNWMPTRSIWNQHAYHIDNVNDDGTIPQQEAKSWLSHNTYRLNAFAGRSPLDQTDLTASRLVLTDNGFGQKPSLSVRIGNAGFTALDRSVMVAFYQGAPSANGILLGKLNLDTLGVGEYKDLVLNEVSLTGNNDLYAIADSELSQTECNEINNQVSIPGTSTVSLGTIQVALDKTDYGPNSPVQLSATVQNSGALKANYHAVLQVDDSEGNQVTGFTPIAIPDLLGGSSISLQQTWNTELLLGGGYWLHGILYDDTGRLAHEHKVPFTITNGQTPALSTLIFADKAVYGSFDQVQLTGRLVNISQNTILPPTLVEIAIYAPDGTLLATSPSSSGELVSTALRDFVVLNNLQDATGGTYQVEMRVKDAATQQLITVKRISFVVERQAIQALSGKVDATPVQVHQGDPVSCLESLQNKAASSLPNVLLTSKLVSAATQQVLSSETRNVDFAANAQLAKSRNIATDNLPVGTYACLLLAEVGGQSLQLGAALFDVLEPPIRINAALETGQHGRILALLDPDAGNDPLGPNHLPTLTVQRAYLAKLLDDAGWSYTLVTDADAFTRELRSGGYVSYLLLSETVKIAETVQQELREAVNRGEGLIEAGGHDQRQGRIDEALGLKFNGKYPRMTGISIDGDGFTATGPMPLQLTDRTLNFTLDGAAELGRFLQDGMVTPDLSLAERPYGRGRSFHAGYDLLAEASWPGADSRHGQLLLDTLDRTHPVPLVPYAHSVYPVTVKLANLGIATPGRVVLNLPVNIAVIDAGGASQTDSQLVWDFNLAKNAEAEYTAWLKLPEVPVTLKATVESGSGSHYKLQQEQTLDVDIVSANDLQAALEAITPLTANAYKQPRSDLQQAETQRLAGNWLATLDALRSAADRLSVIGTAIAAQIRLSTDRALRSISIKTVTP
jgi:hypothetical protein